MANRSRAALLEFMDYLANKGLMNRTTAASRKAAANKLLGILEEFEAGDVSKLDIDAVMTRFHHLHGANYTPETLSVYKSRTKSAIEDFVRYQTDPLNFKPGLQPVQRKSEKAKVARPSEVLGDADTRPKVTAEAPPAEVNILPVPIRPNLTIKISGLAI